MQEEKQGVVRSAEKQDLKSSRVCHCERSAAIPIYLKAMFFTTEENEDTLRQAQGRQRKP
jgi:hypothetical protein